MKVKFLLYFWGSWMIWTSHFNPLQAQDISVINKDAVKTIKIYNEKEINTANLESSPAFMGDKVAFLYTDSKGKLFDPKIDESFFQIGYSDVGINNQLISKIPYHKKINSPSHEGPMSYDLQQNKMFLTRSVKEKIKSGNAEKDTFFLRILTADLNLSKPDVEPISINVKNYHICHPTLSTDGKKMIFSSSKPNGNGKMDLYSAYFDGKSWVGMIGLGDHINTASNEVFPFFLNDSILIFASDRSGGLGGLDIYVSMLKNGEWTRAEILPSPINSSYDDLGLILRENLKSGYFASNRPGGQGKDDIYRMESSAPIFGKDENIMVSTYLTVMDKLTLEPLEKVNVKLTPLAVDINQYTMSGYNVDMLSGRDPGELVLKLSPKKGQAFPAFETDAEGKATIMLKKDQKYLVNLEADGFNPITVIYDYNAFGEVFNMVMEPADNEENGEDEGDSDVEEMQKNVTNPSLKEITKNEQEKNGIENKKAGDVIIFENIYFDYNSSNVAPDAVSELDILSQVMLKKPTLKIRVESHTDSRGTPSYNMQLSIKRAEAVRSYLVSKGANELNIEIKGFGESKPRNHCKDNIACKEVDHKYNRRTEIVILED